MLCRSGLRPPWQQKIFSSTMAATGRQLKQSVKVFHNLMLYLLLPTKTIITLALGYLWLDAVSHQVKLLGCELQVIYLVLTFIVKSVDSVDGGTLVVAAE